MLAPMGKLNSRLGAALAIAAVLALAGCASTTTSPDAAAPTPTVAVTEQAIKAAEISTIDDGIAWARGLDGDASAQEISAGVVAIGKLVPDLDIWFATNNEIGSALIQLNADVLGDPSNAGTKVDDLQAIVDDIEAAIEKGPNP